MNYEPGVYVTPTIRLVRLLGQGGMGSVWTADHLGLHTQVAVKFMAPELATNKDAVSRFTREAAAASRVKSPHIVQVFDHGVTEAGIPYIVMELMEGHDVTHQVEESGPMSVVATAHVLAQACRALQKAHDAGIIHRDIKPDNVFLTDPGGGEPFVKVLDFGIAKDAKMTELGMTGTGAMVGTPYYMSPEQVMSAKHVDHRTDVWAITLVAYYCLTGAVPYTADNLGALCVEICSGNPAPPSRFRPDLGPDVDAFFARALARDINQRFQTARELGVAFDQVANRAPSFVDAATNDGRGSLAAISSASVLRASQASTEAGVPAVSQVPGQTMSDLAASTGGPPPARQGGSSKASLLVIPLGLGTLAAGAFLTFNFLLKPSPGSPPALAASAAVPDPRAPTAGSALANPSDPVLTPAPPAPNQGGDPPPAPGNPGKIAKPGATGSHLVIHDGAPPPVKVPGKLVKPAATGEKDHGF